ncbi:mandelate racemase/muconate lactonizing enzyme family protein [Halomicrobium salinisoli]|uniref:mandelate racemase/muconate lactonizing enzyme family protein n=1 Tax=Halomicrobium salinisoli TaxID=2878391 RepID=UPI001CF0D2FF|nr:mandelate racemase/muconate lactonizing enzyme family protein [Halomicrobium salinisoli]
MTGTTVRSVETVALRSEPDEPFGYAQAWVEERTALLVRVETADGGVGWGECWGPIAGSRETIEDFLAPIVEGRDPADVERIYEDLRDRTRAAYQSVVPYPAISGVDLALWDLRGKRRGESVASMLGGRRRDAVRAYATGHYFKHGADLEAQYERIAAEAAANADRLGAVKAKVGLSLLGYGPDEDVELVRRIRDAVGPETTLLVDANYAYDAGTARRVGRELADLDVYWFEEPVPPTDVDGYARLRDALDVRVAGGECHTPPEFDRLFEAGAVDVAQPDLCNAGGLTAGRRIADRAAGAGVPVVPHVWGTPVAIAASLQLIATLPGRPWLEFDSSSNPLREELAPDGFAAGDDGTVAVPDGPGLGVDLDADALDRYRV